MKARSPSFQALRIVLALVPRRLVLAQAALTLAVSLSENFGLILLVPIIGAVSGGALPPAIGRIFSTLGLSTSLGSLLVIFVGLVALRAFLQFARALFGKHMAIRIADRLRLRCFHLLLHAEWRTLGAMRQSDNASLIIVNVDRVHFAFEQLITGSATLIALAGAGATALLLSPRVAFGVAAGGLLVLAAYGGMRRRAMKLGEILGAAYDEVFLLMGESLGSLRLLKSMGGENRVENRLRTTIAHQRAAEIDYLKTSSLGHGVLQVLAASVLAVSVWIAITRFGLTATVLLPLVALFARAVPLLAVLQENWQNWLHGVPAVLECHDLIARLEPVQEVELEPERPAPMLRTAIRCEGLLVRHDGRDRPAVDRASFEVPALSTTALVGPSGAGKSTIADILGGLISPDEGCILVDGTEIDAGLRRAWRRSVSYVQQEPVLFHASIRDNLLLASGEAGEGEIRAALEAASAGFVFALPDGLDTIVGDRGAKLSGGERQRISLARALLRKPGLLILDEPTSSLDAENEAAIAEALARLHGTVTILLIAHRGALGSLADRTITLSGGQVVAIDDRTLQARGESLTGIG